MQTEITDTRYAFWSFIGHHMALWFKLLSSTMGKHVTSYFFNTTICL